MQTRASGLVVAGLFSFALALGAGGTAQANTLPELSPASTFEAAGAGQGQWFDDFAQSVLADQEAFALPAFEAPSMAEPAAASADQGTTAAAPAPEAGSQVAQPFGGGADHGAPPKHEPPKHEPPKHEPPQHEPPKHEPPQHGGHEGKPGHGDEQNQGQDQDQGQGQGQQQGQQQGQDQGQAQGQNQNVVVTVVVENKIENKVENKLENHQSLHNSNHNANGGSVHASNAVALSHKGEHSGSHAADLSRPPAGHDTDATASAPVAQGELAHTGTGWNGLPLLLGATALIGTGGVLIRFNRSRRA